MNGRRPEGRPAAASITGFADRKLPRRAPRGALRRGALKDIHRYYVFHGLGANTLFMSVSPEQNSSKKRKWNDLVVREGRMVDPTLTGTIAYDREKQEKRDI